MSAQLSALDKRWQYAAAALSALAGFIHILVAPDHFEEWIGYGVFFVIASACQWLFALIVLAYTPPQRELLWTGILGNAAIIALWAVTRTLGLPFFGPEAGEVEPVGLVDSISKLVELALIACLAIMLRSQSSAGEHEDR